METLEEVTQTILRSFCFTCQSPHLEKLISYEADSGEVQQYKVHQPCNSSVRPSLIDRYQVGSSAHGMITDAGDHIMFVHVNSIIGVLMLSQVNP